jgi:hypothetical protein
VEVANKHLALYLQSEFVASVQGGEERSQMNQ